jgi:hypothetical protein
LQITKPDAAACRLIEIANGVEAVQDGRIFIERVNEPFSRLGLEAAPINSAPGSSGRSLLVSLG